MAQHHLLTQWVAHPAGDPAVGLEHIISSRNTACLLLLFVLLTLWGRDCLLRWVCTVYPVLPASYELQG